MNPSLSIFRVNRTACLAVLVLLAVPLTIGVVQSKGASGSPSGQKVLSADGPIVPPTQQPPKSVV